MQHNVLSWRSNKESLISYYLEMSPDIILINSHGLHSDEALKIPGYKIHKINTLNSHADGSAIAIKFDIPQKLQDDFDTDVLAIEVNTSLGPIIIATT